MRKLFRTSQEIFDTVATHLLHQGKKSHINAQTDDCISAYRGEDGSKCAIGILVPDYKYRRFMEGKYCSHPRIKEAARISDEDGDLAWDLQTVHDEYEPDDWLVLLQRVADRYGLKTDVLADKKGKANDRR